MHYYGPATYVFLLAVFLKQFYLFGSGGVQPGDLLFVLAFLGVLVSKGISFRIAKKDLALLGFVVMTIVINLFHFATTGSRSFLLPCAYYLFNLMVVFGFRYIGSDERFACKLIILARAIFAFQLVLYVVHLGRWYDADRYMGTFNDPNQFGYYVLSLYFMAHLASAGISRKITLADDAIVLALLLTSLSTGMLAAFAVLFVLKRVIIPLRIGVGLGILKSLAAVVAMAALFAGVPAMSATSGVGGTISDAADRIAAKVSKMADFSVQGEYSESIVLDRNLDKIILYPEYMIYGSGEGGWDRFDGTRNDHEIHSTWLGILFCYGAVPFVLLCTWTWINAKRKRDSVSVCVEIATIVESLLLANQRQPLFWLLLMFSPSDVRCVDEWEKVSG